MIKEKTPVLSLYVHDRIFNKNKNFFMIIVGPTGSGKSYSALTLAEKFDESFNVDRCCFKAKDFMNQINTLVNSGQDVRGKVVLWDEMGVEHSAREFMTISNRVINYFFQTSRNLNLIIIITVPLLSFIDSNTRKLAHCICETVGINHTTKEVVLKVKMQQTNVMTGKEYPKYLRYTRNGIRYAMKRVRVKLPSKKLRDPYEIKKLEFNKELNQSIMEKLEGVEHKKVKPFTQKQEEIALLLSNKSIDVVSKELNVSPTSIYAHKTNMEKKGAVFKPIWENKHIIRYDIEGFNPNSIDNGEEPPI